MDLKEWARAFAGAPLSDANRAIRLRLERSRAALNAVLLVQQADITENMFDGIEGRLTCLCTRADLQPKELIGLPLEVQFVTDRGTLRRLSVIVVAARRGQSDRDATALQLTVRDAFAILEQRRNSRVFMGKSVLDIARLLLDEHRRRLPALASAFDYRFMGLAEERYPARAFTFQYNENDAAFLRRLFKEAGLAWFFRPLAPEGGDDTPRHQLVLFDDGWHLPQSAAAEMRYQRQEGTAQRDGITLWAPACELVPGSIARSSWDYKAARAEQAQDLSVADQGEMGNELAAGLCDARIDMPHAADSQQDYQRLARRAIQHHEYRATAVHGAGGVRDMAVGEWATIRGHAELEAQPLAQRAYLFVSVHHLAQNNLPNTLQARVQALFRASAAAVGGWQAWRGDDPGEQAEAQGAEPPRYRNRFVAVHRNTPIVPPWNPATDFPPTPPLVGTVVGAPGEVVWCDDRYRFKVLIPGLDPADHAHAQGAGTSGQGADSAWLRMDIGWAGAYLGMHFPLRVGMEVNIGFQQGNPSRPVITGVRYNAANPPPRFSHTSSLPGSARYLSGIVTREIHGHSANQLRLDDTTGQLSAQLASEHAHSQLNLGCLTHPRGDRGGQPRGEGFELCGDESGAIRAAKVLLIATWKRLQAAGNQLSCEEHVALMADALALFKSLGEYAAQHLALPIDSAAQTELASHVKAAEGGSNVDPQGQGGEPTLNLSGAAGLAMTTPKTLLSYAGVNIDCVAQQHLQYAAGQRCSVNAGQGISLFAHHGALQAIAHHGPLLLQSQHGEIQANAATNIKLTVTNGELVGMAEVIKFIAKDGSFIQIGDGGITLGTQGPIASKASSFPLSKPATMAVELPTFSDGTPDQKFKLHYGNGTLAAQRRYRITMSDGSVKTGASDARGLTDLLARDAMHIANVDILTDE